MLTLLFLPLLQLPLFSLAYTWTFKSAPQQCSTLTIDITGGGTPPFRLLLIPSGPTPFSNNTEVRRIVDQQFNETSVSLQLKFPTNSQFVAVVSDATKFGSGGTSAAAVVASSSDNSCFDASQNVVAPFTFSIDPQNQIVQCVPTRLDWDPSKPQGTVKFIGIIPGGESFEIPAGTVTDESNQGRQTGFSWTPNVRGGTALIIVGGDNRGTGTAGSIPVTVSSGIDNNSTCLNDSSPSSTPGNPAGGSYPTSINGAGTSSSSGGSNNVGAIVGGVIGGLALLIALVLLLLFFRRRRRLHKHEKEKPVDLLIDDDGDGSNRHSRNELPQFYQPEPFLIPDPTVTSDAQSDDNRRSMTSASRSETPDPSSIGTTTTRKGGYQPRPMRPVNIIQHDDAGPSAAPKEDEEAETIELPPAYTNIRTDSGTNITTAAPLVESSA
ncbi:hypothetical protein C8J56DRAFT_172712 [Mycena floridula]|nr:hypothetical protein C8J56DRAFT_172712 [Mycena floridula]